ncbi:tRNA-dihydrouridine synthase [Nocardioides marmotae]|uniref:tRNA-dihydrouridine synthase n=1 Tax=Nocardioides marmotae TaxID=2663857 RepID=UPI0014958706|nr:tRNA-dihydrouridine synthase [Nocardioides marmotae]MBC9735097.1 tRNA-dihydrouridine synthase [Nocardioides marmotae]QKE01727.1 dihydroorotate dehydrogenase [Nocardioides marmotae]
MIDLGNPVVVAAGCGGTGRELAALGGLEGIGAFTTRSLTLNARSGGPAPRIAETASGLVHSTGLPGPGLEMFLATELPWLVQQPPRVVVSITGASVAEHAEVARRLARAPGVRGIEVNLAVPDARAHGLLDVREPFHAANVVAAVVREAQDLPVLAKVRADVLRVAESARVVTDAGAAGVVVGGPQAAALPDGRPAGLSGPAVRPLALRCVTEVRAALPGVPVVGGGGITTAEDARAFLDAGAVAVQVGTALLHDPTAAARLAAALA